MKAYVAVLLFLVAAVLVLAPGCYGRQCDGSVDYYGAKEGQGRMLDSNTWESNPIEGSWLAYPGQRTWVFDIPQLDGRTPTILDAYISGVQTPATTGHFTEGSGNLVLFLQTRANHIEVRNESCSDYFLRLVIRTEPSNDAGAPDAAADADADVVDAAEAGTTP